MSMFDIDNTLKVGGSPRLKANEIYTVQLIDVKAEDITAKNNQVYKTIYLKFVNKDNATYEHRFFEPSSKESLVDSPYQAGAKMPSDLSQFRYTIQHMIEALNPNLFTQIKEGKKFEIKTWADMRKFVVQAFTPGLNKDIEIKLVAQKEGYPTLPKYPVGLSKTNELYMKTRFISVASTTGTPNLAFTPTEKKAMETQEKASKASPSQMADVDFAPTKASEETPAATFDI